jgi:hypothetical protein
LGRQGGRGKRLLGQQVQLPPSTLSGGSKFSKVKGHLLVGLIAYSIVPE